MILLNVFNGLMLMMSFDYNNASIISEITLYVMVLAFLAIPIGVLILIVRLIRKKPVKKVGIFLIICLLVGFASIVLGRRASFIVQYFEMISMTMPSIWMT